MVRHRLARLEPLTVAAGAGLAAAVGAAAVWLTLALSRDYSQGIETWDTVDESWFVVFTVAWLAGLGLSVAPRCLRRPLGRTCRRLSLAGVILCGLLVAASPLRRGRPRAAARGGVRRGRRRRRRGRRHGRAACGPRSGHGRGVCPSAQGACGGVQHVRAGERFCGRVCGRCEPRGRSGISGADARVLIPLIVVFRALRAPCALPRSRCVVASRLLFSCPFAFVRVCVRSVNACNPAWRAPGRGARSSAVNQRVSSRLPKQNDTTITIDSSSRFLEVT